VCVSLLSMVLEGVVETPRLRGRNLSDSTKYNVDTKRGLGAVGSAHA
jgi:hypothetical protein